MSIASRSWHAVGLASIVAAHLSLAAWADPAIAGEQAPPMAKPQAVPQVAEPPAEVPAGTTPVTPAAGIEKELEGDMDAQKRRADIEKEIQATWAMVNRAKKMALDFQLARAEIADIINRGECGGAGRVLANLDAQQTESLKLSAYLADKCKSAAEGTDLKRTCASERGKIEVELAGYEKDRATLLKMCPKG